MTDFPVTIFHNPDCGTSRNALAMIKAAGYAPTIIDYQRTGWTHTQLAALFAAIDATPRDMLRERIHLAFAEGMDAVILNAMVDHPILVNRPIVVTPRGTRLCRPSECVLDLLDRQPGHFVKEDGEIIR